MKTRVAAIEAALSSVRGGRVLFVGMPPLGDVQAVTDGDMLDAIFVAGFSGSAFEHARAARERVRNGGVLALVLTIERGGFSALAQRALAAFDPKKRPHSLEEACAALLSAGVHRVKVIEIDGLRGEAVVCGEVAWSEGGG
jgi:hypothetical protein